MKRELLQNVKAIPYASGDVIDRTGFLSAVVAVSALAAGNVKLAITHADASDGTFEAVTDERLVVGGPAEAKATPPEKHPKAPGEDKDKKQAGGGGK